MISDWPLAIALAVVFVALSWVRWRWFKARMTRSTRAKQAPPRE